MIDNLYQNTLLKLKNDQRPQIKLTPELISALKNAWQESLPKVLCILSHTKNTSDEFNQLILDTFRQKIDTNTTIFLLGVSEKHIISHSLKNGNVVPNDFMEILKILLKRKQPLVKEWTLRIIESMGPLNLRLQKEIRECRPGFFKYFNSHLRASDEIINLLEMQWKR
jgi:hypothetical protein